MTDMRILIVSTSERVGGGAIAASRLYHALSEYGADVRMLVRDRQTSDCRVTAVGNMFPKLWERLCVWCLNGFDRRAMWQVDLANAGVSLLQTPEYWQADVIHLHWVNQGMLSLSALQRMIADGKRIVWTLHDEWPYLGVCHYRASCTCEQCVGCPLIGGAVAHRLWKRKRRIYERAADKGLLTFVGCSRWIMEQARAALPGMDVCHVNNAIPQDIFHEMDRKTLREKWQLPQDRPVMMFCCQKLSDERKGMTYLLQALEYLEQDPQVDPKPLVLVVGKWDGTLNHPWFLPVGSVADEATMAELYATADLFVTPSLQDNLPNTIAEAMSVGTPCVGFDVGGIPEMIDHLYDGYVARLRDAADLAQGIKYCLSRNLTQAVLSHARRSYSPESVARQYMEVYASPIKK